MEMKCQSQDFGLSDSLWEYMSDLDVAISVARQEE